MESGSYGITSDSRKIRRHSRGGLPNSTKSEPVLPNFASNGLGSRPRESTYVCVAPIDGSMATRWEQSWVCRKLSQVLWIPVVGGADVPLGERRVGAPLLWRPAADEARQLREDWEELSEMIHLGQASEITARLGEALQIRPKAAHSREATWTLDGDSHWVAQNPRGWYLRASFTSALLRKHFALPS